MNYSVLMLSGLLLAFNCYAAELTVDVKSTDTDQSIGTVHFKDSQYGLLITPKLSKLPAGIHGFHIHEHPDCSKDGNAAGGHYDPQNTKSHEGPYGNGHLGDLPVLYVNKEKKADIVNLAPRLKVSDLKGRSLMIHAGGDNYSNTPHLGGGGKRIACGVITGEAHKK